MSGIGTSKRDLDLLYLDAPSLMLDGETFLAPAVIPSDAYRDVRLAYLDAEQVVELLNHLEDSLKHPCSVEFTDHG